MDEDALQKIIDKIMEFGTMYGMKILGAIIILIIGRIVAGIVRTLTRKGLERTKVEASLVKFASSLIYYLILVFVVIAAISKLGVQTGSFIAVVGAGGLAIGLALQGSLANFAAGVLILLFRPFRVDDFISAAGEIGAVQEIGIFTTTLNSPDNKRVIIPNAAVTGGVITNFNVNGLRRVDLVAGISYEADIAQAQEVLTNLLANHPKVLKDPAPTIEVLELADSSVNFAVRPWVDPADYWDVYFSVTRGIKEELDKAGISIPFPQRDVHMYQTA